MGMDCLKHALLVIALGGLLCGCAAGTGHQPGAGAAKPSAGAAEGKSKPKLEIDFTKRYDVYFQAGDYGASTLVELKGCRFIGYVGQGEVVSSGKRVNSMSSYSKAEPYVPDLRHLFLDEMVLERADGRRIYIRGGSIVYFAESAP
jgi:hypothetical protein